MEQSLQHSRLPTQLPCRHMQTSALHGIMPDGSGGQACSAKVILSSRPFGPGVLPNRQGNRPRGWRRAVAVAGGEGGD